MDEQMARYVQGFFCNLHKVNRTLCSLKLSIRTTPSEEGCAEGGKTVFLYSVGKCHLLTLAGMFWSSGSDGVSFSPMFD